MKRTTVAADSHSGIPKDEAEALGIKILSMPFDIGNATYYEDRDITREEFYDILRKGADVSTTQPSPMAVCEFWDELLEEYDEILYVPISSGLSGSYNTALALSEEEKYKDKVFVVDCGRVSTTMHRLILDGYELINNGYSASETRDILDRDRGKMVMYVALSTVEYLKKGGRIKPAAATVASILSIKPVMKFDVGVLDVHRKVRGFRKARREMIEAMKNEINTNFREYYDSARLHILAASSSNAEVTQEWVNEIKEAFGDIDVMCDDLSLGVSCHIGPDALGIGCSVMPEELVR